MENNTLLRCRITLDLKSYKNRSCADRIIVAKNSIFLKSKDNKDSLTSVLISFRVVGSETGRVKRTCSIDIRRRLAITRESERENPFPDGGGKDGGSGDRTYRFLKCPEPPGAARLTRARQVGRS